VAASSDRVFDGVPFVPAVGLSAREDALLREELAAGRNPRRVRWRRKLAAIRAAGDDHFDGKLLVKGGLLIDAIKKSEDPRQRNTKYEESWPLFECRIKALLADRPLLLNWVRARYGHRYGVALRPSALAHATLTDLLLDPRLAGSIEVVKVSPHERWASLRGGA